MSTNDGRSPKPLRPLLIRRGFIPGTAAYKRAYERERWHRRSALSKKKCGLVKKVKQKIRMKVDSGYAKKVKETWAKAAKNYCKKNREKVNEYKRKDYGRNRERRLSKINAARDRREPHRKLANLFRRAKQGDITVAEFRSDLRRAIEQLNALAVRANGKGLSGRERTSKQTK